MQALTDLTRRLDALEPKRDLKPWNLLSASELAEALPPIPWLCEGIGLAPGAVSLFAGYGYSRKTMALQSLAVSVAAGQSAWGVFGVRKGPVLHLDYEQGRRVTQERYQRLCKASGVSLHDLPIRVASMPHVYLDGSDAPDDLLKLCDGMALVIVDSLRAAFPSADENSSEVRTYLDVLNRVSERTGAVMSTIHHARKPSKDNADGATFAIRGSSALFDACQSVYVFEGAKDTPTTVHHQKDRIRGVTCADFGLTSEDMALGNDPRWGLKVVHLESEQRRQADDLKAAETRARSVLEVRSRIEASLVREFAGSRTDVKALVKGRTEHFDAAWAQLVSEGRLRRGGTHRRPVWVLE